MLRLPSASRASPVMEPGLRCVSIKVKSTLSKYVLGMADSENLATALTTVLLDLCDNHRLPGLCDARLAQIHEQLFRVMVLHQIVPQRLPFIAIFLVEGIHVEGLLMKSITSKNRSTKKIRGKSRKTSAESNKSNTH
jgi:hypothetical protein